MIYSLSGTLSLPIARTSHLLTIEHAADFHTSHKLVVFLRHNVHGDGLCDAGRAADPGQALAYAASKLGRLACSAGKCVLIVVSDTPWAGKPLLRTLRQAVLANELRDLTRLLRFLQYQGINMSLVPLQYRVLFVNVASLFWSAFLSNMANAEKQQKSGELPALTDISAAERKKKTDEL
jgi:hypothetical protein